MTSTLRTPRALLLRALGLAPCGPFVAALPSSCGGLTGHDASLDRGGDAQAIDGGREGDADAPDGGSEGGTRRPTAYLAWKSPGGTAGTGPAVVVSGDGLVRIWSSAWGFDPEAPPASPTGTLNVETADVDVLFDQLAALDVSGLPHPADWLDCRPSLYFRLCAGCQATTLSYYRASQLKPEMEPVWVWFDRVLGVKGTGNPRSFCDF